MCIPPFPPYFASNAEKVSMQRMYRHLVCQFLLLPVSATHCLGELSEEPVVASISCHPYRRGIAIGPTDPPGTKLDTVDTAYRQTFSAFNTFVCTITTVCLLT